MSITVSGITPAQVSGNNILIDESGSFTVSQSIIATIYLTGGGCDGKDGDWNGNIVDEFLKPIVNSGSGVSHSGKGGDGGYINVITNVRIDGNKSVSISIADRNNQTGTSVVINGKSYSCSSLGSFREGGKGGEVPPANSGDPYTAEDRVKLPGKGYNGVNTPLGYIGSSGGGGAACNGEMHANNGLVGGIGAGSGTEHRKNGTDAVGYGCGGGGGACCGHIAKYPTYGMFLQDNPNGTEEDYKNISQKGWTYGGKGKKGCVIISYEEIPKYTLTVICNPAEGGDALVSGNENYTCEDSITIETYEGDKFAITPYTANRRRFVDVVSNDVEILGKNHKFIMPARNAVVYVNFVPLYYLTIICDEAAGGSAEVKDIEGNKSWACNPRLTVDAAEGDKFYINPQYNSGYEFLGITSDDAEIVDGDRITMPAKDAVVIVHFEKIPVHEPVIPTEERPPESGKEPPKYVIQRRFKRNITKQDKRKDEYYSSSNKFNKCKLGSGCGCNTYNASDYTDTFHIGKH